jgi:hypothetical protein
MQTWMLEVKVKDDLYLFIYFSVLKNEPGHSLLMHSQDAVSMSCMRLMQSHHTIS